MIPVSPRRKKEQGGFALLMVFVLAAIIALSLYMQLPRAAFESQRAKEELLQDRGKEYIRGIQLYVAKNKKFPQTLDDLDKNTPQYHFIRHRYVDPMTGKDDWRIIHTNGMFLTDSLVQKAGQQQQGEQKAANTFITESASIGSTGNPGNAGATIANRRRPSDNMQPGGIPTEVDFASAQNNAQGGAANQLNPNYQGPPLATNPNQPGFGQPAGQFGQPAGTTGQTAQSGQPGQPVQPGQTGVPGQVMPGQVGVPGIPNQQPGHQANLPSGSQPGQPLSGGLGSNPVQIGAGATPIGSTPQQQQGAVGTPVTGNAAPGTPGQPFSGNNPVAQAIMQQLTQPRGQGLAGSQPGGAMGGGMAGVASKAENDSIKVYYERQKYNEWEFVYIMNRDKRTSSGLLLDPGYTNTQRPPMPGETGTTPAPTK